MAFKYALLAVALCLCRGDKDDKKWVWNESSRNPEGRSFSTGLSIGRPGSRYNVFEETDDYRPIGPTPQYYPGNQPIPVSQLPTPSSGPGVSFIPDKRPGGGLYTEVSVNPTYAQQGPYQPQEPTPGILTGPIPSWVKQGPIKDFDRCKCSEKFNCNSPGISYGHCDVGKQYCCYSTKKDAGGPIPSKPTHSIENGILVGPGGPVDPLPGITNYPRPPKQIGGFGGPTPAFRPQGGFGVVNNNNYGRPGGGFGGSNQYSEANGVLVGPGGPYDGAIGLLGRQAPKSGGQA